MRCTLGTARKGQITVFIIVGLLLLIVTALILVLQDQIYDISSSTFFPTQEGKVSSYITDCVKTVGEDALEIIGIQGGYIEFPEFYDQSNYIEVSPFLAVPLWGNRDTVYYPSLEMILSDLDNYIEENVRDCLLGTEAFTESYDIIEKSEIVSNTVFRDESTLFNVEWTVEVRDKMGEVLSEIIVHQIESPIKFKKIYIMAESIIKYEYSSFKFEDLVQDMIALEHPDVPTSGLEMSCTKREWDIAKVKSTLSDMIRVNFGHLTVEGSNFKGFDEETYPYYNSHYVWDIDYMDNDLSVYFRPDQNSGINIHVTPTSGGRLQSSQVKGLDLIPILCTQQWKFTYDVEFPLMIQVVDDTGYDFNFASTVNLKRNFPDKSSQDLRPQNIVQSNYEKEYCDESLLQYEVFYSTESVIENNLTGVYFTDPLDGANVTYTCLKYTCDIGATQYDYGQRGDISGIEKLTPACTNAVIRAEKPGYTDTYVFQEVADDTTVELQLRPLKDISSTNIEVYTHVVSPEDCEQGTCFTIGEALPYTGDVMLTAKFYEYERNTTDTLFSLDEATHEDSVYVGSETNDTLTLLAGAEFEYDVEVFLMGTSSIQGGYKAVMLVPSTDVEGMVVHALMLNEANPYFSDFMLQLKSLSEQVNEVEFR